MIDFRYHIVSVVAVFLALGLGILIGANVGSGPLSERFESDLRRARTERNDAQARSDELAAALNQRNQLLGEEIAPWVVDGRLDGRNVLFVTDGATNRWRDSVRDAILRAGARPVGNLVLTDKWKLEAEGAVQELVETVIRPVVPSFDPGNDPARAALTLLGQRLPEPTGQALAERMVQAGFVVAEGREGEQTWPPQDSLVVALPGAYPRTSPQPEWIAALAMGSAEVTATLVVSGSPDDHTAVTVLRETEDVPRRLSTFDTGEEDLGGIGVVSALLVAMNERGGHFGTEAERRYVPQPA